MRIQQTVHRRATPFVASTAMLPLCLISPWNSSALTSLAVILIEKLAGIIGNQTQAESYSFVIQSRYEDITVLVLVN